MSFNHVPSTKAPKNIKDDYVDARVALFPRRMSCRLTRKRRKRSNTDDGARNTRTSIAARENSDYEVDATEIKHKKCKVDKSTHHFTSEPPSTYQAVSVDIDKIQKSIFKEFIYRDMFLGIKVKKFRFGHTDFVLRKTCTFELFSQMATR